MCGENNTFNFSTCLSNNCWISSKKYADLGSKKLRYETGWRWQPCPSTFPHKTLWTTEKPWITDNYQQVPVSSRIPDYECLMANLQQQEGSRSAPSTVWPIRLQNNRHSCWGVAKDQKLFKKKIRAESLFYVPDKQNKMITSIYPENLIVLGAQLLKLGGRSCFGPKCLQPGVVWTMT